MRYDIILSEFTKSKVVDICRFFHFVLFVNKFGCKRRHIWQPRLSYLVPNWFALLKHRPRDWMKNSIIHAAKPKLPLIDRIKNNAKGGNSSGKGFLSASRSLLSHCHAAAIAHLDFAFASCSFSRATGMDKAWRWFLRIFSTVVVRVLVGLAIRGLSPLPPPSTSIKQW